MECREIDIYGYEEMHDHLSTLSTQYPILHVESIGSSVLGRPIQVVQMGVGERKIHINAAFHANEWITTPLLMQFIEDCLHCNTTGEQLYGYDVQALLAEAELWLVPMVNPDGVELVVRGRETISDKQLREAVFNWNEQSDDYTGWKANIRGVDLNDQFPAFWEVECERRTVSGPSSRDYGGNAPLTEPEAKAIAAFTQKEEFDVVIALHTQGKEIYWNYRDLECPHAEAYANRLAQVSGYAAIKLTGSDAGYKDWFIQETGRPGFTIELGEGVNPLPISDMQDIYPNMARLLLEAISRSEPQVG
ncbi:M14 family metallopeptidase [Paenibacillus albiflavus]|nr:M14 family metallocarboxypeptidase [Paenibacillus albiflavus]